MHHTIELEKNNLALVKIKGDGDKTIALQFVKDAEEVFKQIEKDTKLNAVVDMTESGLSDYEGILVYRDFLKDERLGKIAFVIKDQVVKAFVKIATELRKEPTEVFESMEEARNWIN